MNAKKIYITSTEVSSLLKLIEKMDPHSSLTFYKFVKPNKNQPSTSNSWPTKKFIQIRTKIKPTFLRQTSLKSSQKLISFSLPMVLVLAATCGQSVLAGSTSAAGASTVRAASNAPRTKALPEIVIYNFREFPYKETVVNERSWSEYENACAQSPKCLHLHGLDHTRCLRQCVSPSCYLEIYSKDELEEGEIDVRLSSFKGCFFQRMGRHRYP